MSSPIPPVRVPIVAGDDGSVAAAVRELTGQLKGLQAEGRRTKAAIDPIAAGMAKANAGTQAWERGLSTLSAQQGRAAGTTKGLAQSAITAAGAIGTLAASYAAVKLVGFIRDSLEAAATLQELSQRTGASVETLSVLKFAGDRAGVGMDDLATGFKGLAVSLGNLRDGNKEAVAGFKAIGVSAQELAGLSVDQAFQRIVEALGQMPAGFDRAEAAVAIFGRSGAALIPLMDDLAKKGFAEARREAEKFNAVISGEEAAKADAFSDRLGDLKNAAGGAGRDIGLLLIPPLTGLLELVQTLLSPVRKLVDLLGALPPEVLRALPLGLGAFAGGRTAPSPAATGPSPSRALGHRASPFLPDPAEEKKAKDTEQERLRLLREAEAAATRRTEAERSAALWLAEQRETLERMLASSSKIADDLVQARIGSLVAGQQTLPFGDLPLDVSTNSGNAAKTLEERRAATEAYVRSLLEEANATNLAFQNLGQSLREGVASELTDFFSRGILEAQSFGDAVKELGRTILGTIQQITAQLLAAQIVQGVFGLFAGGIPKAPGGLNPGDLAGEAASAPSFARGGYTGHGGKYQPAGIVHKGEFVVNADATRSNFALLSRLNGGWRGTGRSYASGGLVAGDGAGEAMDGALHVSHDPGLILKIVRANFPVLLAENPKTLRSLGR